MSRAGRQPGLDKERAGHFVAVVREIRVILVSVIVLLAAGTALAYGPVHVDAGMAALVTSGWAEPASLFLSGTALLGIAGAVRRLPAGDSGRVPAGSNS